jgi:FtsP/CotA-like multicopper oxidase with cupredoxin domain
VTYSQLGIYTEEPKRFDYAITGSRVGTYTDWPHPHTHTPDEMAEAGFYFVGELPVHESSFLSLFLNVRCQ